MAKEPEDDDQLALQDEHMAIPPRLPILPLKDVVVFPHMIIPLLVNRPKSLRLIDEVVVKDRLVGLVAQREPDKDDLRTGDLYDFGTAAVILKMLKFPDNSTRILVQGLARIRVQSFIQSEPFFVGKVERVESIVEESVEMKALAANASQQFQNLISLLPQLPDELKVAVMNIQDPGKLADVIASNLNISVEERQRLLSTLSVKERLRRVTALLARDLEVLELGKKIQSQVKSELDKNQREYFLRQQLKAIQDELGTGDEHARELGELKKKLDEAKLPPEARKEADRELDRLRNMPPQASEYIVARTYLDWMISLPWAKSTQDNLDIGVAENVLNEDHYDLEKVKERILEYLAVLKLKPDSKGTILCFVGPPGTGKTSLGKSIARALGRKFVRMSLGGVRDEAEIRGHRRTYVGALPGRIIQSIRKAESNNPVLMLDEIDKLGTDFRGDPSSALLEVLDPEQNFAFSDHYLEVPFDVSRIIFITTANMLDPIPPALLDRMEVLELPGYTAEEKLAIARQYLVPKQVAANGLTAAEFTINDEALLLLIGEYTREAGLRNLERNIASLCRKVAKDVARDGRKPHPIDKVEVRKLLGPPKYFPEVAERTSEPGVSTGLAWTPSGGDILFIESTRVAGTGHLTLTGYLGDVMKESAQAALSYVRANAEHLGLDSKMVRKSDIHIHVPAGAIPKDGPSAGITIGVSLISLFKGRPVRPDVAMTGEITLRGRILRVGGIKEKVLAARRAGIKTIVMPKYNEMDLEEVPAQAKGDMKFFFVDKLDEALPIVFEGVSIEEDSPSAKEPPVRRAPAPAAVKAKGRQP
jgi:ATP-dependent Lon protease